MTTIKTQEIYRINNLSELEPKVLAKLVRRFKQFEQPRIKKLQRYYLGETDVLQRVFKDTTKPNNKIVNNFSSQIVDNETGYFIGKPVTYHTATNKELLEQLQYVFDRNHEQKHNTLLSSSSSICGIGYELLYIDSNNVLKIAHLDPLNTFLVYDTTIEQHVLAGVRIVESENYATGKKEVTVYLYTENDIVTFKMNGFNLTELERENHYFNGVPIIAYYNNQYAQGSFEKVMTLIDAYDSTVSDSQNDISMFSDSYMIFKGLNAEGEELSEMKQNRLIQFEDKDGDVSFLTKSDSNVAVEEHKNRLKQDIVLFSGVPDLQSESFGANLSGIAIQFKMQPLEQKVAIKQNYFSEGLDRRIQLITNYLNISQLDSTKYDYTTISYKFKRNIPYNLHEYGQFALNVNGILSRETILSEFPFISDVQEELDKLNKQYTDSMYSYQQYEMNEISQDESNTRYLSEKVES